MRRVVITGMGAIPRSDTCALETWAAMREGRAGIGPIANIPTDLLRVKIAAEVRGLRSAAHFDSKRLPLLDRVSQFALVAAREAVRAVRTRLPRRRSRRAHGLHRRHRHRRREHAQRAIAALLRREQSARASADDPARDGQRAGVPHRHRVRPDAVPRSRSRARAPRPITR